MFKVTSDDETPELLDDTDLLDDEAIDAAVAAFRDELDVIDPASFDVDPLVDPSDDPEDLESWGD